MLASTGLTTVNAASAAADAYACPAGYFCGWSGESATGQIYKTNKSVADLGAWDNRIRSYVNRTSSIACVYEDRNYAVSGGYFPDRPAGAGAYSSYPTATTSSIKFVPTERECSQPAYPVRSGSPRPPHRPCGVHRQTVALPGPLRRPRRARPGRLGRLERHGEPHRQR
ncbi:peptidase inhibitor family I36 protein [Streptomyces noursei]|uniref:peptidase inhibitor family I36 protein n=1 Tax=Streptomyces noursei TaxID=1971 RepID=UPI00380E82D0